MATTTDLSVLKINYLTQAQYSTAVNNNTINPNELYLTPSATLTIAEGGTGATTANGAINVLLNGLPTWTADPTDNTYLVRQNTDGSATYGKVTFSTVWNYIKGKINANASDLSVYVKKSGDTMTGNLNLKWTNTDASLANNNVSAIQYPTTFHILDNASRTLARLECIVHTDGRIGSYWYVRNYNTSGTQVAQKGISMYMSKDGTMTYSVSDPAKFTSAISALPLSGGTMTGQVVNNFSSNGTARHLTNVAFYENNASSYTGTIKIKLPHTTANCVMQTFRIIVYDYNGNSGAELIISGYTYNNGSWYNYAACPVGTFTKGIRLSYDGTNYCILLGTTTSTWNYSKVVLADVYSGYNAIPTSGYTISLITDETGYTSTTVSTHLRADKVYGAVWNDYAEYRQTEKGLQPGRVVIETGNGDLKLSDRRLQPGANVISDTFGFAIGETDKNKTPIAVSGRVLAYPFEPIEEFRKHIGGPVCSGPVGTVSIMNANEERLYPSRIIGTVSEIPDYETWGTENVKVNGRIWIRVK